MLKDLVKANRSYRGFDETYQFTKENKKKRKKHVKRKHS